MRITILGTGAMAAALGGRWAGAGHQVCIAGRSVDKAAALATRLGAGVRASGLSAAAVADADAVLAAVTWDGVGEALEAVGAGTRTLAGTTLLDPTNALVHGTGEARLPVGVSAAERIAELAPGAHVVKAFHLFPAEHWTDPAAARATVAICGDQSDALERAGVLIRAAGAEPAVVGGLHRARQLEEAAGLVIRLFFAGFDPRGAVPGAA
ncbi:NADPH-dependent F420 reductase [Nocardia higoensis]|uniref:NADPH-dependent F420 reductase n=1 Tax=Nocardia higoensis TaxID=228599 RepID=UPI00030F6E83|nr:NAD(P)-binding domain-containing protein [Nocardia higoensis]